jgi:hypothetical protein
MLPLVINAIYGLKFPGRDRFTSMILLFVIFGVAMLRYGIGADWFGYNWIYYMIGIDNWHNVIFDPNSHGELLFRIIAKIFNEFALSFCAFMAFFAFLTGLIYFNFLRKVKDYRGCYILYVYCFYYFMYINSGIRGGLVLAMTSCLIIPSFLEKKWIKFFFYFLIACGFHKSSLVLILLLIINSKIYLKYKFLLFCIVIIYCLYVIVFGFDFISSNFINNFVVYKSTGMFWQSFVFRIIIFCFIFFMYKNSTYINKNIKILFQIYLLSILVYFLLVNNEFLSSRLAIYFKSVEMFLLPYLLTHQKRIKANFVYLVTFLFYFVGYGLYGIYAQGTLSGYYNNDILRHQYCSIFNKKDLINLRVRGSKALEEIDIIRKREIFQ